jgi:hypothetical protein
MSVPDPCVEFALRSRGGFLDSRSKSVLNASPELAHRDAVYNVRFVKLAPARRIVEAVSFVTTDPAFSGEMTMIATSEEVSGGARSLCVQEPAARLADGGQRGRLAP